MTGIDPASLPPGLPIPFDILLFITGITLPLSTVIVCAVWLGISIPVLILLFGTSTAKTRRTPLFIANVVALLLAMSISLCYTVVLMENVLKPSTTSFHRGGILAGSYLIMIGESFIDSILIMRIYVLFHPHQTSRGILIAIFGPLITLKLGRVSVGTVYLVGFARQMSKMHSAAEFSQIVLSRTEPDIGWLLQVVDNLLCSAIFLTKLHQVRSLSARISGGDSRASFVQRLRILFWIALSNFFFPAVVNIALVVLTFMDKDYAHFLPLSISNIFVEAFGVLFATIWANTTRATTEKNVGSRSEDGSLVHSIHFTSPSSQTFSGDTSFDSPVERPRAVHNRGGGTIVLREIKVGPPDSDVMVIS